MKTKSFLLLLTGLFLAGTISAQDAWNKYITGVSVTYDETIDFFKSMDKKYPQAKLLEIGHSDNGRPLHLFVISPEKIFNPDSLRAKGYTLLLVNNGIHPGEPDGINASIRLSKFLLDGSEKMPEKVALLIVPVYNIDGALNTGQYFRSGQNGPRTVGFRGNYRNLDLNRDFIKCDSENARSFNRMYSSWDPDVFVDTHVTDGADYQYVMTLIDSQKDKLHPAISKVMQRTILPYLYRAMNAIGQPMSPYVNVWGESPENGMDGFLESPRFASGYSALYNAFPFVTETHMLKPFPERVECTYQFLKLSLTACSIYGTTLRSARLAARDTIRTKQEYFPLHWTLDTTKTDSLFFLGYKTTTKKSEVTGLDILGFDRTQAYGKNIAYRNTFTPTITVKKPEAYLVPQAWKEVIERLQLNGIKMSRLKKDTSIRAEVYYISDYQTSKTPYEGHYLHSKVEVKTDTNTVRCFAGDYLIYCNQDKNRYIIETLEPQATDAFFAWNFFDEILQQKEWFSDYLFDKDAAEILAANPDMKAAFEEKKKTDPSFASSSWAMYSWIFQRSFWHEPTHNRYPVLRIISE